MNWEGNNNTFDEGANIDSKIPVVDEDEDEDEDEDDDSLDPKSSQVKEEDDAVCLFPSISFLAIQ